MEIDATDFPFDLVKADIVKPLKAGSVNGPNAVIGDKKVFFPPHENVVLLSHVWYNNWPFSGLLLVWSKCREFAPMAEIHLGIRTPIFMLGKKVILGADYLALEICSEGGMILGET